MNHQVIKPSNITNDDEAAAMAAMFQQQTANWEETQEKMSQLVALRLPSLCYLAHIVPNEHCFSSLSSTRHPHLL